MARKKQEQYTEQGLATPWEDLIKWLKDGGYSYSTLSEEFAYIFREYPEIEEFWCWLDLLASVCEYPHDYTTKAMDTEELVNNSNKNMSPRLQEGLAVMAQSIANSLQHEIDQKNGIWDMD